MNRELFKNVRKCIIACRSLSPFTQYIKRDSQNGQVENHVICSKNKC